VIVRTRLLRNGKTLACILLRVTIYRKKWRFFRLLPFSVHLLQQSEEGDVGADVLVL